MSKSFVIGIAGGSASGKTTFVSSFEKEFNLYKIKTFHMDAYFKSESMRPYVKAPITKKMYMDDNHPETIDLPLLREHLADEIKKNEADLILVEGLLTLYDEEICSLLDLKLFIECRADERIVRRIRRNMEKGLTFDQITDVYLDMVRYRHDEYVEASKWRADLILNGSSFSEKAFMILVSAVKSRIEG